MKPSHRTVTPLTLYPSPLNGEREEIFVAFFPGRRSRSDLAPGYARPPRWGFQLAAHTWEDWIGEWF